MKLKSWMSTLERQIDAATVLVGFERRPAADDPTPAASILRSLRGTYLALSNGLDLVEDATPLFRVRVADSGEPVLTQAGAPVPVSSPFLAYLFSTAGVDLVPGQIVFVEPHVAKLSIEEALGRVALDQAFTEREWVTRRAALEVAAARPRPEDLETLRGLEIRASLLWDRKRELVAASLIAEEFLEQAITIARPFPGEPEAA
jgi:hypothetical protein